MPALHPLLFPYTTLFRSFVNGHSSVTCIDIGDTPALCTDSVRRRESALALSQPLHDRIQELARRRRLLMVRSEEHTSELQSRENLVCRLLLEKNKQRYNN